MSAWSRERRLKQASPNGAVQGRLAYAQQASGFAGRDQPGAFGLVLETQGIRLNVCLTEPPVTAGGDHGGAQEAPSHGARHSRLADAKASGHILRTDQSLQDVVLGLTNPNQKAVALQLRSARRAWDPKSGAGVSSLKKCRDRPIPSPISCQTFHRAKCARTFRKESGTHL